jgi:hypothetical protein
MHTFSFVVALSFHTLTEEELAADADPRPKTWLTADRGETEDREQAASFAFRTNTSLGDDLAIEMRMDELTGGVGSTVDLSQGVERAFSSLAMATLTVWKMHHPEEGGEPTDEQLNEVLRQLNVEGAKTPAEKHVVRVAGGFERMQALLDNLRVAASWQATAVEVPAGWEDFGTMELPDRIKAAVVSAFKLARDEAQAALGK